MTDAPPGPPPGPRDPADGWVELPDGRRFWGRAGAAGLLAAAPDGAVLLQHRVSWSHFGGTWGLPGGARHVGESSLDGALREAHEETGIDPARLRPRFAVRLDLGVWTYTTVVVAAEARLPVSVSDRESTELEWVPAVALEARELHPGFGAAWPLLRDRLRDPDPVLVVDAANVVGSRPDGWWKDRAGAATRLLERLARLAAVGVPERNGAEGNGPDGDRAEVDGSDGDGAEGSSPAGIRMEGNRSDGDRVGRNGPGAQPAVEGGTAEYGADGSRADVDGVQEGGGGLLPVVRRWPSIRVVLEGRANDAADVAGLDVVRAPGEGDDTVVAQVRAAIAAGRPVTAVTADRALADRIRAEGGAVQGPSRLLELLDAVE